jgi:hypothetical protein
MGIFFKNKPQHVQVLLDMSSQRANQVRVVPAISSCPYHASPARQAMPRSVEGALAEPERVTAQSN